MVKGKSHVALQSSGTTAATANKDTPPTPTPPKSDYFYKYTLTVLLMFNLES